MTPHIRCLKDTTTVLENLVALTTPEKLLFKPAPDRWSIYEVLNHLTDVEKLAVGLRAKRILDEDIPLFVDYDREARYRAGAYGNDDGERALENFERRGRLRSPGSRRSGLPIGSDGESITSWGRLSSPRS